MKQEVWDVFFKTPAEKTEGGGGDKIISNLK